jgi:hypothetical protein
MAVAVAVFKFRVWDHASGHYVTASRMGTAAAIERIGGIITEDSEELVRESEIDDSGFYPPKSSKDRIDRSQR